MNLVAVDTSTRWAGVGLLSESADSGERTEMVWRSDQNHGCELMPAVVELASQAGIRPTDITHLAVALGPGGFSAVRVGISTVIGLALPNDLTVVGIPTHLIESFPYLERASASSPILSLLPAGRGELAWARYESETEESAIGLSTTNELVASLAPGALLCGEGTELLAGMVDPESILCGDPPTRSPISMLEIASRRIANNDSTPLSELRPIYARPPSITKPKKPV